MTNTKYYYFLCIQKIFIYLCITSLLLFAFTFSPASNENPQQFRNLRAYLNGTKDYNSSSTYKKEDTLTILNFTYPIFILLSLYLICQIKKYYEESENINMQVFKYIYISNIGYFIIGFSDIKFNDQEISYYLFYVSIAITGIGTIALLVIFFKNICNLLEIFFSFKAIGMYFILPCQYIWGFLSLTDPCCTQDTYTVTTYADGHKESDYCCVCMFNAIVWIIKRFAMLITTIIYYLVLVIAVFPFWVALKILVTFFLLITCYYCRKNNNSDNFSRIGSVSTPLYPGME